MDWTISALLWYGWCLHQFGGVHAQVTPAPDSIWDENGGETVPVNGVCPQYLAQQGSATNPPRLYTKCYKTDRSVSSSSWCFLGGGVTGQVDDCVGKLMSQLQITATQVCCPGPCAWIFEHAFSRHTFSQTYSSIQQPDFIYFQGEDNLPPDPAIIPPPVFPSTVPRPPSLRAGCVLASDTNKPATGIAPLQRTAGRCPNIIDSVVPGGSAPDTRSSSPVCVQQTYTLRPKPPIGSPTYDHTMTTSCTVHCCEGDLCNRATLRNNNGLWPSIDFVFRNDGCRRVINDVFIGSATFAVSFILLFV